MVHGLKKFKEYFENHSHQYVLIGGTACDILMGELGANSIALLSLKIHLSLK